MLELVGTILIILGALFTVVAILSVALSHARGLGPRRIKKSREIAAENKNTQRLG